MVPATFKILHINGKAIIRNDVVLTYPVRKGEFVQVQVGHEMYTCIVDSITWVGEEVPAADLNLVSASNVVLRVGRPVVLLHSLPTTFRSVTPIPPSSIEKGT